MSIVIGYYRWRYDFGRLRYHDGSRLCMLCAQVDPCYQWLFWGACQKLKAWTATTGMLFLLPALRADPQGALEGGASCLSQEFLSVQSANSFWDLLDFFHGAPFP